MSHCLTSLVCAFVRSFMCFGSSLSKRPRSYCLDGRRPLMEDDLLWKTTFYGRRPSMEDDLQWKTAFNGRRPLCSSFISLPIRSCWPIKLPLHVPFSVVYFQFFRVLAFFILPLKILQFCMLY